MEDSLPGDLALTLGADIEDGLSRSERKTSPSSLFVFDCQCELYGASAEAVRAFNASRRRIHGIRGAFK